MSVALLLSFIGLAVHKATQVKEVKLQNSIELKSREAKLIELNHKFDDVLNQKIETEEQKKEQVKQIEELQKQNEALQRDLQAKRQQQAEEAEKLARASVFAPQRAFAAPANYGGSCAEWIAAAGINDVANANELIRRESGCNPNAVNPSSGACGVAQELECGKSGCSTPPNGDGACQVRWMDKYVHERYGSWAAAVAFHSAHNWY